MEQHPLLRRMTITSVPLWIGGLLKNVIMALAAGEEPPSSLWYALSLSLSLSSLFSVCVWGTWNWEILDDLQIMHRYLSLALDNFCTHTQSHQKIKVIKGSLIWVFDKHRISISIFLVNHKFVFANLGFSKLIFSHQDLTDPILINAVKGMWCWSSFNNFQLVTSSQYMKIEVSFHAVLQLFHHYGLEWEGPYKIK